MRFAFWKSVPVDATRHVCETCKRVAAKSYHATNANVLADGTRPPAGWVRRTIATGVLGMGRKLATFCTTCWRSRVRELCGKNLRAQPKGSVTDRRLLFEALRPVWRRRWNCGERFVPAT